MSVQLTAGQLSVLLTIKHVTFSDAHVGKDETIQLIGLTAVEDLFNRKLIITYHVNHVVGKCLMLTDTGKHFVYKLIQQANQLLYPIN